METQGLKAASVDNGGGAVVPSAETATAALAKAKLAPNPDAGKADMTVQIDYTLKDPGAYPVLLLTYEIMCQSGNDAATLPLTRSFLSYTASTDGQGILTGIGYVPLPASMQTQVASTVSAIS